MNYYEKRMNYYVELENKKHAELIIRLVFGCFEEETGEIDFTSEEKERVIEIILDKTDLKDGDENNCIITAVLYYESSINTMDRYQLRNVRIIRKDRDQLIRVYLNYREIRGSIKLLDKDIRARYKQNTSFWLTYAHKLIKYVALVNEITKARCLQKFKHCKVQCHGAKENMFVCESCKGGLTNECLFESIDARK